MFLVLGGLSGAGKSSVGFCLSQSGYVWIELDWRRGGDAVDGLRLRDEWDAFLDRGDPAPLVRRFPANTVLTVPSNVIIENYGDEQPVRVRYLKATQQQCFGRVRPFGPGESVTLDYWLHHNTQLLAYLNGPECPAVRQVAAFNNAEQPRTTEELARLLIS